ncbi:MAG: minor structural protein (endogenous virus) [Lactobacillus phage ViSo-2018b]|nr:MAG: minor structural protein [Lactobacillus phage ViSo-2018b]
MRSETKLNSEIYSGTVFVGQISPDVSATSRVTLSLSSMSSGQTAETMASANGGKTYIVDDAANRQYNPNWRTTYLEGCFHQ